MDPIRAPSLFLSTADQSPPLPVLHSLLQPAKRLSLLLFVECVPFPFPPQADQVKEPGEVFVFLEHNGIGQKYALFYEVNSALFVTVIDQGLRDSD